MSKLQTPLDSGRTGNLEYTSLWWKTVRNVILGMLVSVLPAFVFYSVAFSYTPEQLRLMLRIIPYPVFAGLAVDLGLNWIYLRPLRRLREAGGGARVYARLHNLPLFCFVRVFGPHAVAVTIVAQLCVTYANAHWSLGIPTRDFWTYWLLNLTLVPIGHAIFEYHANAWAARELLSKLAERFEKAAKAPHVWRVGLATRLAIFYTMLGISPLLLLGAAVYLRTRSGSLALADLAMVIGGVAALNLLLLLLFARDVHLQTRTLLASFKRIEGGDLAGRVDLFSPDEFGQISDGVNEMILRLRDRERIRNLFGVYLSTEVSRAILDGGVSLEGESRHVSILFCDIRNFTRFSAQRTPREVVERLNEFFSKMAGAISQHGGSINKFLGDGFMAVFGAPAPQADHARRAIEAALAMETELAALNAQLRERSQNEVEFGIGIDSGEVVAGNVGSKDRLEYTVIGDPVNRSSRIEQLNKSLRTRILISERTYLASGLDSGRVLPPVPVKGIEEPLKIVTIGALTTSASGI